MSNKILLAFSLLALVSCAKQTDIPKGNNLQIDDKKIQAMQNMDDISAQRLVFNTFTPDEKVLFAKEHIANFIQENNLSREQVGLINEMVAKITPRLYTDKKYAAIFKVTEIDPWMIKATKLFSDLEIIQIAFNMGKNLEDGSMNNSNYAPKVCKCAVGSKFTCYQVVVSNPPSAVYGKCELIGTCTETNGGCGFMWASDCNGNHCDNTDA